jgi:hypothetical protein
MNEDEKWADFIFNMKFWLIVTTVGLVIYEIVGEP